VGIFWKLSRRQSYGGVIQDLFQSKPVGWGRGKTQFCKVEEPIDGGSVSMEFEYLSLSPVRCTRALKISLSLTNLSCGYERGRRPVTRAKIVAARLKISDITAFTGSRDAV